jgi:hypothetical protein
LRYICCNKSEYFNKCRAMPTKSNLSRLLPRGAVNEIAQKLGITHGTVSTAISRGRPSHPAVRMAMEMAEASGALATAQKLATLPNAA